MKNNKNFDLYTTLIIVYLALLTLCIALYALIQIYVEDKGTATNLMIWSATLFPSIALLYTFNSWKHQKGSEVISNESISIVKNLNDLENINIKLSQSFKQEHLFKENLNYFIQQIQLNISKLNLLETLVIAKNNGIEDLKLTNLIFDYTISSSRVCIKLHSISENLYKIKSFIEILKVIEEHSKATINLKEYIALYSLYQKV